MKLLQELLSLLYPDKCPFCGRVLDGGEEGLCGICRRELPWVEKGWQKQVEFCDGCIAPLWYRDRVPEAVHRYKFGGDSGYAHPLGGLMAQCLTGRWEQPVDLITWVPLSTKRRRKRGYDQAELLARRVGELTALPVEPVLVKRRQGETQSSLADDSQRRANVLGMYACLPQAELEGKRLVLVDDVTTSGATLSACAACLRGAGAKAVMGLTLAFAR